jgi:hypothetical protein
VAGYDPQGGHSRRKYLGMTAEAWGVVGAIAAVAAVVLTILLHFSGESGNTSGSPVIAPTASKAPSERPSPLDASRPAPSAASSPSFASAAPSPVRVSLGELCDSPGMENAYICGDSDGGTVQAGSRLFTYYGQSNGNAFAEPPNWSLVLQFGSNTCTDIKLQFSTDSSTDPGTTAYLQIVQVNLPPTTVSAAPGTVGTLTTKLDGGAFELQADSSDGSSVYVNGYAICSSPSGQ